MSNNTQFQIRFWYILGGFIYLQLPLIFFSVDIVVGVQIALWVLWCAILLWGSYRLWRTLQLHSQANATEAQSISMDMAEVKQTRERLQQIQHELDTIVRVFPDLFVRIDAKGTIFDYMSGDMPAFGIPPERFLGQMIEDVLPPEPATAFAEAITKTLRNQELQSIEYPLKIENIVHYFEMRLLPEDDGSVLCIGRDITERKRAESELKESEEKFRQLAENFNGVLLIRDLKTRQLIYISPSYFTFWGDDPKNVLNNSFSILDAVHPDDRALAKESFAKQKLGEPFTVEYRVYGKGKALHWVQSRHILIKNGEGEIYRIATLIEDITERKSAENALRENQQIFDQLAENINEVLFVREIQPSKLIYISPRCEELWQVDQATIIEDDSVMLDQVHVDDLPKLQQMLTQRLGGNPGEVKYRICRPDGTERWLRSRTFPIHDEKGNIYRLAGVVADITEQVEQQDILLETEHLRAELEKERELNILKENFISMVSHEFRTPLTVIQSSSEMVERYSDRMTDEQRDRHIEKIKTQVGHMVDMLDDVLELGLGKSDKFKFNPESMDLLTFCRALVDEFTMTDDRDQPIMFKHVDQFDEVTMDKRLLTHIIRNLITNARKYSDDGQSVYFDLQAEDKYAVFTIRDDGIGIPVSSQDRLFEPFQRASNVGNKRGSGLGLAIVKNSVDVHGGTIDFTSTEGVGTTFIVRLPIRFFDLNF